MSSLFTPRRHRIDTIEEALETFAKVIGSDDTQSGIEDALSGPGSPTVTITLKVRRDAKTPSLLAASIETAVSTELGGISLYGLDH